MKIKDSTGFESLQQQLAAAGMNAEWQNWIETNLKRGCTHASLAEILLNNHFDRKLATFAIAVISSRMASGQVSGVEEYEAPASRFADCNKIFLDDRMVQVAARLESPDIAVLAGFLSHDECDELMALSRSKLNRSTVVNPLTGTLDDHKDRTSEGCFFDISENELIRRIDYRLAKLTGYPVDHGEGIQILHYGTGGEYKPHFDFFPYEEPGSATHLAKGGQRVVTVVMYLNDVEEGGETLFPRAGGFRVMPRKGWAAYFSYCDAAGRVDAATLHAGAPVLAGEKWIATKWIRQGVYA